MTILRNILLVAIIATVVVWVVTRSSVFVFAQTSWGIAVGCGGIEVLYDSATARDFVVNRRGTGWYPTWDLHTQWWDWPKDDGAFLTIPFWLILAILLPPWWFMGRKSRRRKRWAREGCCLSCGYNLQGSESDTCSECGAGYERACNPKI